MILVGWNKEEIIKLINASRQLMGIKNPANEQSNSSSSSKKWHWYCDYLCAQFWLFCTGQAALHLLRCSFSVLLSLSLPCGTARNSWRLPEQTCFCTSFWTNPHLNSKGLISPWAQMQPADILQEEKRGNLDRKGSWPLLRAVCLLLYWGGEKKEEDKFLYVPGTGLYLGNEMITLTDILLRKKRISI